MKEYFYTKVLASLVGIVMTILAIIFGLFALIGIGLSNAWSSENSTSTTQYSSVFPIFVMIFSIGLFTFIGSLRLKNKTWNIIYIGLIVLIGIGFIITFFVIWGAIGLKIEIFILFIGFLYICLGYMAYKKR
ncbi:hypothetical protein [Cytobacillus dafuensis]|uniref:Uncharacterized protein n=1 Tax=Cytobacillus dafuensis TaxID=1742359 RepID=A0A5B8YZI9_CYTDA|nr:hypothetical protein [Cytobacillus dafuensis]QED46085.1 hypothetical protein FSZ17_01500 [Cytobacillus dafuensis]